MDLDFADLKTGTKFEQLIRDILITLGYPVRWSGVGPDDGKDLIVSEPGGELFGQKSRQWLISCKNFAESKKSVNYADLTESGDIAGLVDTHGVDGFLVACTTQVSAGCTRQLEALETNKRIPITVWDSATLLRLAANPRVYALLQEYLPSVVGLNGIRVFRTTAPNNFVITGFGFYLHVVERHESDLTFQLDSVKDYLVRLKKLQAGHSPDHVLIRPRSVFFDNKHGAAAYTTEILVHRGTWNQPSTPVDAEEVRNAIIRELEHPEVTVSDYFDGQATVHEVSVRTADFHHDAFHKDHYGYYQHL